MADAWALDLDSPLVQLDELLDHVEADHLSGAAELRARTGADVLMSVHAKSEVVRARRLVAATFGAPVLTRSTIDVGRPAPR